MEKVKVSDNNKENITLKVNLPEVNEVGRSTPADQK
jgi:hypothetical protein